MRNFRNKPKKNKKILFKVLAIKDWTIWNIHILVENKD